MEIITLELTPLNKNPNNLKITSVKFKIMRGYIRKTYDIVAESPEYWFNSCQ